MHGLGHTLVGLGQHEDGVAMLVKCVGTAKRVMGEGHPSTKHFSKGLEDAIAKVKEAGAGPGPGAGAEAN